MLNLRVLVVDEEMHSRQSIQASLSGDPFFILHGCASGGHALATAIEWRPDLILLNDTVPRMDALAVLTQMRSDKRTDPISVVLLTERVDQLLQDRKTFMSKLEDHEHRLVRIETIMEFASRQRRLQRD